MCVAAEGVINLTQDQPAAEKHCTYMHTFDSLHAHIMLTWRQQQQSHANICMCFEAIIGKKKKKSFTT